jgi:predicted RNA-binding protein
MEKLLLELYQNLYHLIGLHRKLLDAVKIERQALRDAEVNSIQEVTYHKEALITSIVQKEKGRQQIVSLIAMRLKRSIAELNLTEVILETQRTDQKMAEMLRSAQATLNLLAKRIQEQNDSNRNLIQESLLHVNQMKTNALGQAAPMSNTYNARGQKTAPGKEARLLSEEA